MHLEHPVAEAVHDQLHRPRVQHVQAVARAREVHAVARVLGVQPVVRRVVDPPQRERGPELAALARVVVDHVEDDLDARPVERLDERAQLVHRPHAGAVGGVGGLGGEEADRVVAPVVGQAALHQGAVAHEGVHGHELDGGHAEREQVVDHRVVRQAQVRAADLGRHRRVQLRQPADVGLVDDGPVPGRLRAPVVAPREGRVDDHRARHVGRAVAVVAGEVGALVPDDVAVERVAPADLAAHGLGVGVEQELGGIEAVPGLGLVGAVHAVAVVLARPGVGQVGVPVEVGALGQRDDVGRATARRPRTGTAPLRSRARRRGRS